MNSLGRNTLIYTACAIGAVAIAVVLLRPPQKVLATARVDRGPLEEVVQLAGRTRHSLRYSVVAPATGTATPLPWQPGDSVRAGDELLQLAVDHSVRQDPAVAAGAQTRLVQAEARLQATQAMAVAARTRTEFADGEYIRRQAEHARGEIPRATLEDARQVRQDARWHQHATEFAIDIARHELDIARAVASLFRNDAPADDVIVRAPAAGIVLKTFTRDGTVPAGEPLLEIADPASLEVHADVTATTAARIDVGMPAHIRFGDGRAPLPARVSRIESLPVTPVDNNDRQRARVVIEPLSRDTALSPPGDAVSVNVELIVWRNEDVVRVPLAAILAQEDRWLAYRLSEGRAYGTPVSLGHRGEDHAEVIGGLMPGDVVVLHPGEGLHEGVRVVPRDTLR